MVNPDTFQCSILIQLVDPDTIVPTAPGRLRQMRSWPPPGGQECVVDPGFSSRSGSNRSRITPDRSQGRIRSDHRAKGPGSSQEFRRGRPVPAARGRPVRTARGRSCTSRPWPPPGGQECVADPGFSSRNDPSSSRFHPDRPGFSIRVSDRPLGPGSSQEFRRGRPVPAAPANGTGSIACKGMGLRSN
jgi:hypothetical protein